MLVFQSNAMKPNLSDDEIQQQLMTAVSHPWVERLVRFGFVAKGTVYLIMGLLAAQAVAGTDEAAGTFGVLTQIITQPFGKFLLLVLTIGLAGYVLWRWVQAAIDPEHEGKLNKKLILQRIGYAMSGLGYASIAYTAISMMIGAEENDDTIEDLAAELMEQPWGLWLLLIGGIAVVGVGISFIYGAYTGAYISEFRPAIGQTLERWTTRIGKLGYAARGVAFVLMGIFIILSAILADSDTAGSLGASLRQLQQQPLGSLWLGLIAFGFIAYSVYMFLVAWYRRFPS
jgi:hypothetical protein